jgi:hypothetical protein
MAYFAQLDRHNIVAQVIAVSNVDAPDPFPASETAGQAFIVSLGLDGEWRQTSYNGTFRYNYAGIGYTYDPARDAFIPPKPYPSWVLNDSTCLWEPPVPYPTDGQDYNWNEETQSWVARPTP